MGTKNPRLQVSLEPDTADVISDIAKRTHRSLSSIAQELISEALELREDLYLSKLANEAEEESKGKKVYPHDEVWKNLV